MQLHPQRLTEKLGFNSIRQATLDVAQSEMGREILRQLQPASDPQEVDAMLDRTREMMRLLESDDPFPLRNLHDVREYLRQSRAEGTLIPLEAFQEIRELVATARNVRKFVADRKENYPTLHGISRDITPLKELEEAILQVINEQGAMRDDASSELRSIRRKLNRRRSELRDTINKVMSKAVSDGMASEEGATIRGGRMVIPIRAEFKRKIQGFVHDVSATGQTVYLEPVEALNINNEIRQLEIAERQEIERILRELTGEVRSRRQPIAHNLELLARLDVVTAKARLGSRMDGRIPARARSRAVYLGQALNPILMLKNLQHEKQEKIVPLNLQLDENERCLMITGPNAGGKSVAMKTLGLCTMMMQAGFAIPAAETTELPLFNGLYVDIGDDQSIESDLSTFSSRLEWMRDTVEHLEPHSMVLIDEAGTGTDPEEGGALFQALIEDLVERDALVVVTTHHGTLKVFANEHPKAVNGSMEFDQATLSPTYKFRKGVPGSSYAFEIARRMELNERILKRAHKLVGENKGNLESLITQLEQQTQEAAELRSKYEVLQAKMEAERNKYQHKREEIEREKEKIREKALQQAKEIMAEANKRIEHAVEQISSLDEPDKEKIKEIRKDVEQFRGKVNRDLNRTKRKRKKKRKSTGKPPEVGDTVRLEDGNTTGELVDVSGKQAVVVTNGLRVKTKYNKLVTVEKAREKKPEKQKVSVNVVGSDDPGTARRVGPSIDVRGYRGEDAVKEVERYLDNAAASGLSTVEIIHGKGEGILRKLIRGYLKQRSDVRHFEDAPWDQGGPGCTVVEL